jgi:hypothetical protein
LETEEAIVNSEILRINPKNLVPQQSKEQMNGSLVKRLEAEMRTHGYDESQPISGVRREDGRIVISDGHHRRLAAIGAGIDQVPVEVHEHGLDCYDKSIQSRFFAPLGNGQKIGRLRLGIFVKKTSPANTIAVADKHPTPS